MWLIHKMNIKNVLLICFACITCFAWIKMHRKLQVLDQLLNSHKHVQGKTSQIMIPGWQSKPYSERLKYVLIWPSNDFFPFSEMAAGQEEFLRLRCPLTNCYVTANKTFLKDIRGFDFIAFMGRNLFVGNLPQPRAVYQIYIYFNMESSPNYSVEEQNFDGFFNWTATYRLDSDIPVPYLQIKDREGNVVGPKTNMEWVPEVPVDKDELPFGLLRQKSHAAAVFYSICHSLSDRELVIEELQRELKGYSLGVDVYGACGPHKCPRKDKTFCDEMLTKKYYFYLSFENSFDVDYVTEKVLTAVQNYVIPVVYGGANYSRFLPPGSYLDASDMSAMTLANTMMDLMKSPGKYLQFFWWKKYYTYHNPIVNDNICNMCAAMNNREMLKRRKHYKKFRRWWNKNNYRYI